MIIVLRRQKTYVNLPLWQRGGQTDPYIGSLLDDHSPASNEPMYRLFRFNLVADL